MVTLAPVSITPSSLFIFIYPPPAPSSSHSSVFLLRLHPSPPLPSPTPFFFSCSQLSWVLPPLAPLLLCLPSGFHGSRNPCFPEPMEAAAQSAGSLVASGQPQVGGSTNMLIVSPSPAISTQGLGWGRLSHGIIVKFLYVLTMWPLRDWGRSYGDPAVASVWNVPHRLVC